MRSGKASVTLVKWNTFWVNPKEPQKLKYAILLSELLKTSMLKYTKINKNSDRSKQSAIVMNANSCRYNVKN